MVVVPAGRDEQRSGIAADHHVEADDAAVEGLGLRDVADVQMHVTEDGLGRHPLIRAGRQVGHDRVQVERQRVHRDVLALPLPLTARAVAVELDAVALGIAQVHGLAHEVVRRSGEARARGGDALDRLGERGAIGHQQREVEQPRGARRAQRRGRRAVQLDERRAGHSAEAGRAVTALDGPQTDHVLVIGLHRVEVADVQADGTEGCCGSERHPVVRTTISGLRCP